MPGRYGTSVGAGGLLCTFFLRYARCEHEPSRALRKSVIILGKLAFVFMRYQACRNVLNKMCERVMSVGEGRRMEGGRNTKD